MAAEKTIRESILPPVQQRLMEFIRQEFRPGYNHYNVSKLIGDASSRQYFRYVDDKLESFILAAYPEAFDPSHFSYGQIYYLLRQIQLPVPEIFQMNGDLGIVLQEDLGNETLQKHLMTAHERERTALLSKAIGYIIRIQQEGTGALRPEYEGYSLAFDEEKLGWELHFFRRHYLGNYRKVDLADEEGLYREFDQLAAELAAAPRFLCHRDYHIRNLMLKEGALYIIDFQDARWGPASYDLVSLLKDSIDLTTREVDQLIDDYLQRSGLPVSRSAFLRQFYLMSVQRLLKALGTYGYQVIVREHFIYEQYMAGSLNRTRLALEELPEFPLIRQIIERELKA